MPLAEGGSDTDLGDTVKKALAPLSSEQAAVGGLCPASGRELLGPSPGRVREEPSVCVWELWAVKRQQTCCVGSAGTALQRQVRGACRHHTSCREGLGW